MRTLESCTPTNMFFHFQNVEKKNNTKLEEFLFAPRRIVNNVVYFLASCVHQQKLNWKPFAKYKYTF